MAEAAPSDRQDRETIFIDRVTSHSGWAGLDEATRTRITDVRAEQAADAIPAGTVEFTIRSLARGDGSLREIVKEIDSAGSGTLGAVTNQFGGGRAGSRTWGCPKPGCPETQSGTNVRADFSGVCPRHKVRLTGPR